MPIDDKQLVASLLLGLGGKFTMTATILTAQPDVAMEQAQETMQAAEARMSLDKGADRREDAGSALELSDGGRPKTQGNRIRKDIRCFKCNKTGHIKRNCRSKDGPGREDHGDSGGAAGLAIMATVLHAGDSWATIANGQWVVDSGASHQMTGDAGSLTGVQPCTPVQVSLADGRTSTARTSGTASLTVDGPTSTRNLDLGDVLVVPGLAVPLFSVRQASSHGFAVEFCNNHVNIKANGTVQAMGESVGRLYILGTAASSGTAGAAAAATTAETWHRRSANLGPNTMARAAAAVTGMTVDKTGFDALRVGTWSPCIEGRMTRAPFPYSTSRSTAPLQLLHTDVMGGMPVLSAGGAAYLVTIIDVYTRFKAVIPICNKGLAKDAVIRIVNLWENQTDKRVKVVCSDGGKEYTGGALTGWLRDKGITHQTTTPYTPQQNGDAERYNRTVIEQVLALLADSGLDAKYWAEAAVTVNYVSNRVTQRHRDGTPYEAFHGSKPDVGHLRVFGCRAWVRVPGELRRKLDARAVAGTFLGFGFGQKGWRVLVDGRVVTSRDVRFDETPIDAGLPADAVQPQHADGADGSVATWPADHDVLDAPGSARVSRTPATSGTQSRAVTLPRPGPIADAVSAARHLVAGNAGGDDSAANVGAEDEAPASGSDQDAASDGGSDSDAPPPLASDSDEEPHAAGEPMSRHPARLLRAKPPHRAHATAAWVSPDGPRVAFGDGTRMPGRISPPVGPRRGLHAWALAASAGGGPDKIHIRRAMKAADWPEFHKANQKEVDALWANET